MDKLLGTYAGTVEDDRDPDQVGRLKVRVPAVYGPAAQPVNSIPTSDLPWALPAGLPAGGTFNSGMVGWLPAVGDHVYVRFLDGEPEKPIWEWGMQDLSQAATMGGWSRSPGGYTGTAAPTSSFLTRYGHILDFQEDTFTVRTASGYMLRFTDSTQQLDVYAPNMVGLVGALKFTGTDYQWNTTNTFTVNTGTGTYSANLNNINAVINTLTASANQLVSPLVLLGPAGQAADPVVRLSDLAALAAALIAIYNTHSHIGNLGKPTSPPIVPMILTPTGSSTTFTA